MNRQRKNRPSPWTARGAALLEQAALSGAHLLAFVLWARWLSPRDWGLFGLAYAAVLFLQGFQRAAVTLPMVPLSASGAGWPAARLRWARLNSGLALAVVTSLLLALALASALWPAGTWLPSLAMAAALWLPLCLHEFARRAAVQESRHGLLAAMGVAYAAVLLLATVAAAALAGTPASPWWPALAMAAASLAAAASYRLASGLAVLPCPAGWPLQPRYREFARWSAASHLAYSGYNFGLQALLAALAGPAAVGVFHACRTLVQPLGSLMAALDSVDKPRAARALVDEGPAGLRRVRRRGVALLLGAGLPYLALVALAAPVLLEWVYGPAYAGQAAVVWGWCLVMACMAVSQPVDTSLYVAERTRSLFRGRAIAAGASLLLAVPLVQALGAAGALLAMALAYATTAGLGVAELHRGLPGTPEAGAAPRDGVGSAGDGPATGGDEPNACDRPPGRDLRPVLYLAWAAFQRRQLSMAPLVGFDCVFLPLGYKGRSHALRAAHYGLLALRTLVCLWRRRPAEVWLQLPQLPLLWVVLLYRAVLDRRLRVVADCHNAVFRPPWLRFPLGLRLLPHCQLILVHNADMLALALGLGLPSARLRVLEDVPPSPFTAPRVLHGLPPVPPAFAGRPRPWVLFPGSYGADEPIAELMQAAQRLPSGTLAVTGRISNIAKNGHVVDYVPLKVRQTGYLPADEFEALLLHADVVLALTRHDGIQLSVCSEALGYGKPMVMADTSLLRRLFGQAAVCVNAADPDAIVQGIQQAWQEAPRWAQASSELARQRRSHWQQHALAACLGQLARPGSPNPVIPHPGACSSPPAEAPQPCPLR